MPSPVAPAPPLHLIDAPFLASIGLADATVPGPARAKRARVLVVDDDEDVAVLVRSLLAPDEIDVAWAPDHDSALEAIRVALYSALLIDYYLGASDGVRLMNELQIRGYDAPMLLLSGSTDPAVDAAAMRAGAANFLSKDELSGPGLSRAIRYARERHVELIRARDLADAMLHQASTDALTGVGNRRAFDFELAKLVEGYGGGGLLMIDLDGLKAINDDLGHLSGDLAIRAVADRISETVRAGDEVYRFGGDEFAVISRGTGLTSFGHRLATVLARVAGPDRLVSASVGWAAREVDDTPATLIQRADKSLYLNKLAHSHLDTGLSSAATTHAGPSVGASVQPTLAAE